MNERDELSEVIANFRDDWYKIDRKAPAGIDRDEAAHILSAGYRRHRTITTTEELNALPVGSVVFRNGRAFQRFAPHPAPFDEYRMWKCTDGGFVRSTKDGSSILPATVLHEGTQP